MFVPCPKCGGLADLLEWGLQCRDCGEQTFRNGNQSSGQKEREVESASVVVPEKASPPPPPIHEAPVPPLDLTCPFCQVRLGASPSQSGSTTACPRCGGKFKIPLPTAQHGVRSAQRYGAAQKHEMRSFASKKIVAAICGILLGGWGIHKFILGLNTAGVIMLVVWLVGLITGMCIVFPLLASFVIHVIGFIEGIIYLTKSDKDFFQTYAIQKKEWF